MLNRVHQLGVLQIARIIVELMYEVSGVWIMHFNNQQMHQIEA